MYVYVYMYMYMCVYIYIYICIFIHMYTHMLRAGTLCRFAGAGATDITVVRVYRFISYRFMLYS